MRASRKVHRRAVRECSTGCGNSPAYGPPRALDQAGRPRKADPAHFVRGEASVPHALYIRSFVDEA